VPYFWEGPNANNRVLTKVLGDKKKVQIGKYTAKHSRATQGILAVDEEALDLVIVVGTCLGVLSQWESFLK
jgi:hypothetical protein